MVTFGFPAVSDSASLIGNGKINILSGSTLLEVISQTEFLNKWEDLFQNCPWATAFQDHRFVTSWYKIYNSTYEPLMVISENENALLGIFPLTIGPKGKIKGAGHDQAEYQVWLSKPAYSDEFFVKSIEALRGRFPDKKIHLKYVPHQTPLEIIKENKMLNDQCFVRSCQQQIMEIDPKKLHEELKKKNRKEKINRLKRMGEFRFDKIISTEDFVKLIDAITIQNDFRKGAMYNKFAFAKDPNRKRFLISLFEKGMLHVTVSKVNNEIIAANAGVTGNGIVHLQGINSHSPFYEKYSPGILHFLYLGLEMNEERLSIFDFTPGKEAYKEMLSTKSLETHELIISSAFQKRKIVLKEAFKNAIFHWFEKKGVESRKLKSFVHQKNQQLDNGKAIFRLGPFDFLNKWRAIEENANELGYYRIKLPHISIHDNEMAIRKNELSDFFKFNPKNSIISEYRFFSDAMRRMKYGQQVYTYVENNTLKACLWFFSEDCKLRENGSTLAQPLSFFFLSLYDCNEIEKMKVFLASVVFQEFQLGLGQEQMILKINQNDRFMKKMSEQLGFEKLNKKS